MLDVKIRLIGCIVFAICACRAQVSKETSTGMASSPQQKVEEWMASRPAGAVSAALVSPACTQFFHAGNLLPYDPAPPNEDTIYEIGSVTKGFNGLLLADQVVCGKVSLNDTLSKLLTDWPGRFSSAAGKVTLLELATHSSGLARLPANMDEAFLTKHINNPYATYTVNDLYAWLDTIQTFTPGDYSYSNAGAGILGHALAVMAGKMYEDLLKERLFLPLGLKNTAITLDDEQKQRLAPGHDASGKAVQNWDFDVLAPAGALRSTISDMAHFLRLAIGIDKKEALFQEALELATRKWGLTSADHLTIGLGWHRSTIDGKILIWHNGGTGGYNSFLGWYPEQQKGVAIAASITIGLNTSADNLALELLHLT